MKVARTSILTALVVLALLLVLPGAIQRLIETRDPYLFSKQFFQDMLARLSGPGKLRFIVQPAVALVIGASQGVKDAQANLPPFIWAVTFHGSRRKDLLRTAVTGVIDLVIVAILLDLIAQALIFHRVHPAAALVLGPVLIAAPYAVGRSVSNLIMHACRTHAAAARMH